MADVPKLKANGACRPPRGARELMSSWKRMDGMRIVVWVSSYSL